MRMIAKVVVFIPPPVPPGDAPMNIRIIMRNMEFSLIWERSKVLKPAVLEKRS